ncbi:alpha-latrocrustotoxin-Lt1a-like [Mytilus edulis]|uniref:alpha-latrocrustotoxin-Lt1a-like n=1 Tax=Mytilus edulis TaxID=6550 RepID=UPI0039EF88F8
MTSRYHSRNSMEDLFTSLRNGSGQLLTEYKRNGGYMDIVDSEGKSLLIHSLFDHNIARTKLLIKLGCNINLGTTNGLSPLHVACIQKSLLQVELLMESGANIKVKTEIGRTPLMQAIITGSYQIVEKLLTLGSEVNVFDNIRNTPLQIALLMKREDIADLLVKQKGIDLSLSFRCRIDEDFLYITKYLLQMGANPFERCQSNSRQKAFFPAMLDLEIVSSHEFSSKVEPIYKEIFTEYGLSTASYTKNKMLQEFLNCSPILRLFEIEPTLQISVDRCVNKVFNKFLSILKTLSGLGLVFPINKDIWQCECENTRLVDIVNQLKNQQQFWSVMYSIRRSPPSLKQQCRTAVRSELTFGVTHKVQQLPLPQQIKQYLCFPELK